MLVHVVAVLVVPMTIVEVVLVITMLHMLAAVPVRVGGLVVCVDLLLSMTLVPVNVVEMIVVVDRFATVSGQVFVVRNFGVPHRHSGFLCAAVRRTLPRSSPEADARKPRLGPHASSGVVVGASAHRLPDPVTASQR